MRKREESARERSVSSSAKSARLARRPGWLKSSKRLRKERQGRLRKRHRESKDLKMLRKKKKRVPLRLLKKLPLLITQNMPKNPPQVKQLKMGPRRDIERRKSQERRRRKSLRRDLSLRERMSSQLPLVKLSKPHQLLVNLMPRRIHRKIRTKLRNYSERLLLL